MKSDLTIVILIIIN